MEAVRLRPRVTWVIRQLGFGGSEKRLYEFLRYLDPHKIDPQVITFEGGNYEDKIRELGVPVIKLSASGQTLKRLKGVISEIRRFRPDIIHGMDSGGIYGRVAGRCLRVPVIMSGFNGSRLPNRTFCWIEYALAPMTDYLIANSHAGEQYLTDTVRANPERIRVIPNGFDFEAARCWKPHDLHQELGLDPTQPIVGQVARLMDVKDPFLFVEVAARVHRQVPEAHFVIVGAGPLRSKVERLIAARGIQSHLTLLGERRDAVNLISSFAVGVLTSRAEGLPNALLEYMFWARPSVVTEVGDCGRLLEQSKGGYIVPAGDANTLTQRIVGLLRNPVEAAMLGQSARSYLEKEFSLTRYCDSLLALYDAALEQHRQATNGNA